MGTKSKFFRVFVAGNTISDGREITPEMIDQVVETFNAETYSPRINVEHIKGFSPEPPFNGYGDVCGVRAQDDEIVVAGKKETRRALYAQVDGNAQLVALTKANQKPYPSVELTESYSGTGKVGMVGLAFTDSPASIATQKLQFSRNAPGTIHAHGADAVALEFEAAPVDSNGIAEAIATGFAKIATMFSRGADKAKEESKPEPKEAANDNFDVAAFSTAIGAHLQACFGSPMNPHGFRRLSFLRKPVLPRNRLPSAYTRTGDAGTSFPGASALGHRQAYRLDGCRRPPHRREG